MPRATGPRQLQRGSIPASMIADTQLPIRAVQDVTNYTGDSPAATRRSALLNPGPSPHPERVH